MSMPVRAARHRVLPLLAALMLGALACAPVGAQEEALTSSPARSKPAPAPAATPAPTARAAGNKTPFCGPGGVDTRCGWFWGADFDQRPEPEEDKPQEKEAPPMLQADPKERCKHKESWQPECGWVHPGKDWDFMKLQEEQLAHQMLLNPGSPWAVKQFQYWVKWALDTVSEVTDVWGYNLHQDQDLNPNLRRATSQLGIRWATERQSMERKEFFSVIKDEGGYLVYWSRSDCIYCKQMADIVVQLGKQTGLDIWNASLDSECEKPFKDRCMVAPATLQPAAMLGVKIVPDIMLYMPKEKVWVRVGSGVEATAPIIARMKIYAQGVRAAAINGKASDLPSQPAVDFSKSAAVRGDADIGFGAGASPERNAP